MNTKKTGEVYVPKGQSFFQKTTATIPHPNDEIIKMSLTKGRKARITLPVAPGDFLQLKFTQSLTGSQNSQTAVIAAFPPDPAAAGYYFPLFPQAVPANVPADASFRSVKFKYFEYSPVFQTLSIPVKFRPGIRDTISNTASAAFNVGFAYAFKFTKNSYKRVYWNNAGSPAALAHSFTKFTYAFGPFLGPTIVDLKTANTDGKVVKDRSVVGITFGGFAVVGYNEFNAGIAVGVDKTFGSQSGSWIYNGKPWVGIVLAIDLIK